MRYNSTEWFDVVEEYRSELTEAVRVQSLAHLEEYGKVAEDWSFTGYAGPLDEIRWISEGDLIFPFDDQVPEQLTFEEFNKLLLAPKEFSCFKFWPKGVELPKRALEVLEMMGFTPGEKLWGPLYWVLDLEDSGSNPPGTLELSYRENELLEGSWPDGKVDLIKETGWAGSDVLVHDDVYPLTQMFLNVWPWETRAKSRRCQPTKPVVPHLVKKGGE